MNGERCAISVLARGHHSLHGSCRGLVGVERGNAGLLLTHRAIAQNKAVVGHSHTARPRPAVAGSLTCSPPVPYNCVIETKPGIHLDFLGREPRWLGSAGLQTVPDRAREATGGQSYLTTVAPECGSRDSASCPLRTARNAERLEPHLELRSGRPQGTRTSAGGCHVPFSIASFGQYKRIVKLKGPAPDGSQFDSRSAPGSSLWM